MLIFPLCPIGISVPVIVEFVILVKSHIFSKTFLATIVFKTITNAETLVHQFATFRANTYRIDIVGVK